MTLINWLKIRVRRCDHCGKLNPPAFDGNKRLCGACAVPGGFYKAQAAIGGVLYGANGKVYTSRLQFPLRIHWLGWWT